MIVRYLLLVLATATTGCSFTYRLLVANQSPSPITVSYVVDKVGKYVPRCPLETPRLVRGATEDIDDIIDQARPVDVTCGDTPTTTTIVVPPDEIVWLFDVTNYRGCNTKYEAILGLSLLKVEGERGSIRYDGKQVLCGFQSDGNLNYVLTYK